MSTQIPTPKLFTDRTNTGYQSAECPKCKGSGFAVIFRGKGGNPMPARCPKCGGEGFLEVPK